MCISSGLSFTEFWQKSELGHDERKGQEQAGTLHSLYTCGGTYDKELSCIAH